MAKQHKMVSLDPELIEEAKKWDVNVSAVTERALREQLQINDDELTKLDEYCDFCGRRELKATIEREGIQERVTEGMTWLYPDGKWICPKCLKTKQRQIFKHA